MRCGAHGSSEVSISRPETESAWEAHQGEWRDPAQIASQWREANRVDPAVFRAQASGSWWDIIDELGICLVVTREYEHLVVALTVAAGRSRTTFLPIPHPSGLAVDRERNRMYLASTRNPNQVLTFAPAPRGLNRRDVHGADFSARPLLPLESSFYPGSAYLHDVALIGGVLHGNAVGHNAVVRLDRAGVVEPVWWPSCVDVGGGVESRWNLIQLNSIAAGRDLESSFFTASTDRVSTRRPGQVNFAVDRRGVVFSGETREAVARGLTRPHSARLNDGVLWVDDSGYGTVGVVADGAYSAITALPGWTRGLCFCGRIAFVGTSRVIPRFRAYAPGLDVQSSRCAVHAIDLQTGNVLGSLRWPKGNQIFAIDWLPREVTAGFPFAGGRRPTARERTVFYTFTLDDGVGGGGG